MLVDCIICEMHASHGHILCVWLQVLFCTQSYKTVVKEAQIKLKSVNQERLSDVVLSDYLLKGRNAIKCLRQINSTTLTTGVWFHNVESRR
mmetsp:Transcript_31639/g.97806  ORF Transcript_31639/g.97806 Transcript_31639/m.97806 type:complete len:91 (-) Transcript_31639:883-1155(-)